MVGSRSVLLRVVDHARFVDLDTLWRRPTAAIRTESYAVATAAVQRRRRQAILILARRGNSWHAVLARRYTVLARRYAELARRGSVLSHHAVLARPHAAVVVETKVVFAAVEGSGWQAGQGFRVVGLAAARGAGDVATPRLRDNPPRNLDPPGKKKRGND